MSRRQLRTTFLGVKTRQDLAALLGQTEQGLCVVIWGRDEDEKYRTFTIGKRSGGIRLIQAPKPPLLVLQWALAPFLDACYEPPPSVHGYVSGRSIRTNAAPHERCCQMLKLDLSNFFPSITFPRVYGLFKSAPFLFSNEVAATIANLVCWEGSLPQGSPVSPVISNMICKGLDRDLSKLAKENSTQYTRYADDLTFSTKSEGPWSLILFDGEVRRPHIALAEIVARNGFVINDSKTRILNKYCRRMVTGVVTNQRLNVPQSFLRKTNRLLKLAGKHGLATVGRWCREQSAPRSLIFKPEDHLVRVLRGRIAYASMIRGDQDALCQKHSLYLENLIAGRPLTDNLFVSNMAAKRLSPVRILHLSDFHFRGGTSWNSTPILDDLIKCICDPNRMNDGPPDLVVITGDIAFSGKMKEYNLALKFLTELYTKLALPPARILIVPGNHDVDRLQINDTSRREQENLLRSQDPGQTIHAMLSDPPLRKLMLRRLDAYQKFREKFYLAGKQSEVWWKETVTLAGMQVGISGLCSSWMSGADKEQGQLMVGLPQVNAAMHPAEGCDLRIALLHHPLSWISERDNESIDAIRASSDVVLHGHTHVSEVSTTYSSVGDITVLGAGACYESSKRPNSFQHVTLDMEARTARCHVYKWKPRERSWGEDRDVGNNSICTMPLKRQ